MLEGSVRRTGDRIVVSVQLVDARTDRKLWASHYDNTLADSVGLQGELANEIAQVLEVETAPEENVRLRARPTLNPKAYGTYLHGRESENRFFAKQGEFDAAEHFYQQAIELDPDFALAHASLSKMVSRNHPQEGKTKARVEAETALRLQPDLGEGHLALAYYFWRCDSDFDRALQELALASAVLPNSSESREPWARSIAAGDSGVRHWKISSARPASIGQRATASLRPGFNLSRRARLARCSARAHPARSRFGKTEPGPVRCWPVSG